MGTRQRPRRQWITGGFALVALGWLTALWLYQAGRVWTGCDTAFGNPDLHGNYVPGGCVVTGETAALTVPWERALNIGGLCALALVCVLAALLVPWRSRWSPLLATGGVAVLLWAAPLGVQRVLDTRDGDVLQYLRGRPAGHAVVEQLPGGWWTVTAEPDVFGFPDFPGNEPLVAGAISIAVAVLLAALLWIDQLRGPATANRGPRPDGGTSGAAPAAGGAPAGTRAPGR
ncbi:hypothetical protein [Bounagaea algeriensis]